MSRANRRQNPASRSAPPSGPAATAERRPIAGAPGASDSGNHIDWRACLAGLLVGELALLILTNGGLNLAGALFGPTERLDGGIVGVGSFLAVILGGFLAARLAGRWGLYQGTAVAIGFILVSVIVQFAQEASIVHSSLNSGAHHIVDLGPMRIDNVISGDLLALFGGSFGGWLARRR
ncbi:MAG TPA: YrzE family protein [Candidatus Dormibacteraeota bacterium]|jgi:hypothetical protein|nr:YrzE family protein [Candidatus Dormibacteraeota bacterium]